MVSSNTFFCRGAVGVVAGSTMITYLLFRKRPREPQRSQYMILRSKLTKTSRDGGLRQLHFKFNLEKGCGVSPVKLINRNWFFPRSLL